MPDSDYDILGVGLPAIDSAPFQMPSFSMLDGELTPQPTAVSTPSSNAPSYTLSTGGNNSGDSLFSGILKGVTATGQSLAQIWGAAQSVELAKDQMSLQRMQAQGQYAVAAATADSNKTIAVTQAQTAAEIEKLKAQAAIAQQQNVTKAAQSGLTVIPGTTASVSPTAILGAIGLALVAAFAFGGGKRKAAK